MTKGSNECSVCALCVYGDCSGVYVYVARIVCGLRICVFVCCGGVCERCAGVAARAACVYVVNG